MKIKDEKIMTLLNEVGLTTEHQQLELEMEKYFIEKKKYDKDIFVESMLQYLTGSDFSSTITVKDVERFKGKLDKPSMWQKYPNWVFEILTIYFSTESNQLEVWFDTEEPMLEYVQKRLQEAESGKIFEDGDWEKYKMMSMFHPEEAFQMMKMNVARAIKKVCSSVEDSKGFRKIEHRLVTFLEDEYIQRLGMKNE